MLVTVPLEHALTEFANSFFSPTALGRCPMNRQGYWTPVPYLATCRRCGESSLAWQQSKASGRWYLCRGRFNRASARFEADRIEFHNCPAYESRQKSSESSRSNPGPEIRAWVERIISHGFHSLAGVRHPDHNGNVRIMQDLNAAVAWLRQVTS